MNANDKYELNECGKCCKKCNEKCDNCVTFTCIEFIPRMAEFCKNVVSVCILIIIVCCIASFFYSICIKDYKFISFSDDDSTIGAMSTIGFIIICIVGLVLIIILTFVGCDVWQTSSIYKCLKRTLFYKKVNSHTEQLLETHSDIV
jgi:glucan phosphoethanolaminetransferase (alkaline phosphatase superfamily)